MKNGILLLLLLGAMALGYLAGKRRADLPAKAQVFASNEIPSPAPVEKDRAATNNDNSAPIEKPTWAEIEERLRATNFAEWGWGMSAERHLAKLVEGLNTADMPELLSFVDQNFQKTKRQGLRFNLLTYWAETHPQSAVDYANKLTNRHRAGGRRGDDCFSSAKVGASHSVRAAYTFPTVDGSLRRTENWPPCLADFQK